MKLLGLLDGYLTFITLNKKYLYYYHNLFVILLDIKEKSHRNHQGLFLKIKYKIPDFFRLSICCNNCSLRSSNGLKLSNTSTLIGLQDGLNRGLRLIRDFVNFLSPLNENSFSTYLFNYCPY